MPVAEALFYIPQHGRVHYRKKEDCICREITIPGILLNCLTGTLKTSIREAFKKKKRIFNDINHICGRGQEKIQTRPGVQQSQAQGKVFFL